MGKKKTAQQHVQQSMGNLVSKAALSQMGPAIERYINHKMKELSSQLAVQQATTLENLFSRVVVLEEIVMEKLGYTTDDLTAKVADIEDRNQGQALVQGAAQHNDVVRLEISTKTNDQDAFQGTSRLMVSNVGTGNTLGVELESAIIGMKSGESKELQFGENKALTAKITVNRVSRAIPKKDQSDVAPSAE